MNTVNATATTSRPSRIRGLLRRGGVTMAAASLAAAGVLGVGATSAQAAITDSGLTCVKPDLVLPTVGVNANQNVLYGGGQLVSAQYKFVSVATSQVSYSNWSPAVRAQTYVPTYISGTWYRMGWSSYYKWTNVYARVAYWNGSYWNVEQRWRQLDNGSCLA
jgi:hypothetical protein